MATKKPVKTHTQIALPIALGKEFKTLCVLNDIRPTDIVRKLLREWIEKEKKKKTTKIPTLAGANP